MIKYVKIENHGRPIVLNDCVKVFGTHGPLYLDTKDIFKCISSGAIVTEYIDGKKVILNFSNYDKDLSTPHINSISKSTNELHTGSITNITTEKNDDTTVIENTQETTSATGYQSNNNYYSKKNNKRK